MCLPAHYHVHTSSGAMPIRTLCCYNMQHAPFTVRACVLCVLCVCVCACVRVRVRVCDWCVVTTTTTITTTTTGMVPEVWDRLQECIASEKCLAAERLGACVRACVRAC